MHEIKKGMGLFHIKSVNYTKNFALFKLFNSSFWIIFIRATLTACPEHKCYKFWENLRLACFNRSGSLYLTFGGIYQHAKN